MKIIPKTFFITGLGRSGTNMLADILNRSREYKVVHEWHFPLIYHDDSLITRKKFPISRFLVHRFPLLQYRPGYGEVNSYLRHTIEPNRIGYEKLIERRAIILRNPKDVISSAMNRSGRTNADFLGVCSKILMEYAKLLLLIKRENHEYKLFYFEKFTNSVDGLQEIIDWAGITDVHVTKNDLKNKININSNSWFPKWQEWEYGCRIGFERIMKDIPVHVSQTYSMDFSYDSMIEHYFK